MHVLKGHLSGTCGAGRAVLAILMVAAGAEHLLHAELFARIVPDYLPNHILLVQVSGYCELAGGVGLLVPRAAVAAAWGLTLLLIAVFPANVYMALNNVPFGGRHYPVLLWLRLPLQIPLIFWSFGYTRTNTSNTSPVGEK